MASYLVTGGAASSVTPCGRVAAARSASHRGQLITGNRRNLRTFAAPNCSKATSRTRAFAEGRRRA